MTSEGLGVPAIGPSYLDLMYFLSCLRQLARNRAQRTGAEVYHKTSEGLGVPAIGPSYIDLM